MKTFQWMSKGAVLLSLVFLMNGCAFRASDAFTHSELLQLALASHVEANWLVNGDLRGDVRGRKAELDDVEHIYLGAGREVYLKLYGDRRRHINNHWTSVGGVGFKYHFGIFGGAPVANAPGDAPGGPTLSYAGSRDGVEVVAFINTIQRELQLIDRGYDFFDAWADGVIVGVGVEFGEWSIEFDSIYDEDNHDSVYDPDFNYPMNADVFVDYWAEPLPPSGLALYY